MEYYFLPLCFGFLLHALKGAISRISPGMMSISKCIGNIWEELDQMTLDWLMDSVGVFGQMTGPNDSEYDDFDTKPPCIDTKRSWSGTGDAVESEMWVRAAAEEGRRAGLKLLHSSLFSDLKITCGAREWNVHKSILGTRCDFFAGCLRVGFKEAQKSTIALDDDDPDTIQALLEYLYTFSYPSSLLNPSSASTRDLSSHMIEPPEVPEAPCLYHQTLDLHILSHKYLVTTLAQMTKERLNALITRSPPSPPLPKTSETQSSAHATTANRPGYLTSYVTFLTTLLTLSPESLTASPDLPALQSAALAITVKNWSWLSKEPECLDMLEREPEVAVRILKALGEMNASPNASSGTGRTGANTTSNVAPMVNGTTGVKEVGLGWSWINERATPAQQN